MIDRAGVQEPAGAAPILDRIVVLDDDPTGVQTLAGIRVLLAWRDSEAIARALEHQASVHVVTNTRALSPARAREVVATAARAALAGVPGARLVLRGDSTLRGHLLEEYLGLCDATGGGRPPLLLVPALPSAGRVTRGGVHLIERDGGAEPLHTTEYARDGVFAYRSARLLEWAAERSDGLFAVAAGRELSLGALRSRGPELVASALDELARSERACVLVADAENEDDLALVARGYAAAVEAGIPAVVRCAPAFAGVLAGTAAKSFVPVPAARDGLLVVCGSYVLTSVRQLAALAADRPQSVVEVDVLELASGHPEAEQGRAALAASDALARTGVAVLATPRVRPAAVSDLAAGLRIAEGLAGAAGRVEPRPGVVIVKGGVTSAVTLRVGFATSEADVLGPVVPGVSRWRARTPRRTLDYLVVPGNVGDDGLLADLTARATGS